MVNKVSPERIYKAYIAAKRLEARNAEAEDEYAEAYGTTVNLKAVKEKIVDQFGISFAALEKIIVSEREKAVAKNSNRRNKQAKGKTEKRINKL